MKEQALQVRPGRAMIVLVCAVIVAAVFAAFWPVLGADFVDYDDTANFLRNEHYRGLGPEQLAWMWTPRAPFFMGHYHPLTWMTLGLDYTIWGMNARGYHLTNLLLHAANSVLVFFVARRLLDQSRGLTAALFAALVWALHPLRVESVAWITERRDLVNGFFALLSALAYLKMAAAENQSSTARWKWLAIGFALFIASLLGKVMTVTLPAVLLVMDVYPLRRLRLDGSLFTPRAASVLLEKVPFFLASAFFIWLGARGQAAGGWLLSWDEHHLPARLAVSCFGLMFYLAQTVFPLPGMLLPIHEIHLPINPLDGRFLASMAGVVLLAIAALLLRRRSPGLAAALACYVILLSPVIGILQNGMQITADRYTYLAVIPWMILLGAPLGMSWATFPRLKPLVLVAAALACATLGVLTWRQCGVWRSTRSLWTYMIQNDPGSSFANNSYGYVVKSGGELVASLAYFEKAIEIQPRFNPLARVNLASTHYALGTNLITRPDGDPARRRADAEAALRHFQAALEQHAILKTDDAQLRTNMGLAMLRLGRDADALVQFRRAIEVDGQLPQPRFNLALALRNMNRRDEAAAELEALVKIHPDHDAARRELKALGGQP